MTVLHFVRTVHSAQQVLFRHAKIQGQIPAFLAEFVCAVAHLVPLLWLESLVVELPHVAARFERAAQLPVLVPHVESVVARVDVVLDIRRSVLS